MMFRSFKQESMGRRISILFRLCMAEIRREMKEKGFGAGDYAFLAVVFTYPGMSQGELSSEIRVDKSYTARALARLEKMGLIKRLADEKNHRIKRVFPTAAAMEIQVDFFNILKNLQATLTRGMTPEQADQTRTVLDMMIHNMDSHPENQLKP